MAKGAIAKQEITKKLFEVFPNAFVYGKEIRIPYNEDGADVEIKITMTCAKTNVGDTLTNEESTVPIASVITEDITDEEKAKVSELVKKFNF